MLRRRHCLSEATIAWLLEGDPSIHVPGQARPPCRSPRWTGDAPETDRERRMGRPLPVAATSRWALGTWLLPTEMDLDFAEQASRRSPFRHGATGQAEQVEHPTCSPRFDELRRGGEGMRICNYPRGSVVGQASRLSIAVRSPARSWPRAGRPATGETPAPLPEHSRGCLNLFL